MDSLWIEHNQRLRLHLVHRQIQPYPEVVFVEPPEIPPADDYSIALDDDIRFADFRYAPAVDSGIFAGQVTNRSVLNVNAHRL